jgi:predicted Zn-dependent peptidase
MSVHTTVLENGIRILSEHMDGIRSVSVGVLVGVGSKNEQPGEQGYAHLLEHMLFQGTGERDAEAIAEMMEIGGGAIGAFTTREYTVYHATVLDEYLPFALEALGDMLGNSVLPQEALDRQRSVILAELAGHDDPLYRANDLLKTALWPDHALGYPTIGFEGTLQQATRNSLLRFMRQHYTADNIILAAAGNVQHDTLVEQARDALWQITPSTRQADLASTPFETKSGILIADNRNLQQVYFTLGWPAPSYTDSDRYTWHVFSTLLGGGPTSRLYRKLREERGLVYHIAAQYQAYQDTGAFVVEGATRPETLIPVLAGILIELATMGDDPLSLDDHYRATQSLISQHLVSGDSAYVRMSRLALQEHYFRRAITSDEVVQGLRTQSSDAIQKVASSTFAAGLPVAALVGPVTEDLLVMISEMFADFGETPELHVVSNEVALPVT